MMNETMGGDDEDGGGDEDGGDGGNDEDSGGELFTLFLYCKRANAQKQPGSQSIARSRSCVNYRYLTTFYR